MGMQNIPTRIENRMPTLVPEPEAVQIFGNTARVCRAYALHTARVVPGARLLPVGNTARVARAYALHTARLWLRRDAADLAPGRSAWINKELENMRILLDYTGFGHHRGVPNKN